MDPQIAQQLALMQQAEGPQVLAEMKAGTLKLASGILTADSRRGTLRLVQDIEGDLRLQWLTRPAGVVELNLVILPHAATVANINDCKDGRVIVVKMADANGRHFFWLQDATRDNDTTLIQKFNDIIQNPPNQAHADMMDEEAQLAQLLSGAGAGGGAGLAAAAAAAGIRLPAGLASSSSSSSSSNATRTTTSTTNASTTTAARPTTTTTTTAGAGAGGAAGGNSLLASLLASAIQMSGGGGGGSGGGAGNNAAVAAMRELARAQAPPFSLVDVLDADKVQEALAGGDDSTAIIDSLRALLPESQRERSDLMTHLRSPQFQQTLTHFDSVAASSQYGQLLASMSLPLDTQHIGIRGFIEAIQKQAEKDMAKKGAGGDSSASTTSSSTASTSTTTSSPPSQP